MTIGRIVVDLLARTGSFETDMARAAKAAEKRSKEIDAAFQKTARNIGTALGGAISVAAITAYTKSLIDNLDALNDVKDATGASIENISALEDVAVRTGTNLDAVSSIMVKFNNVLKEADGKNAAGQALKALGLSAEELKKIDPAEALRKTAVALAGFADDGNKARLIQELFGKSVKEAAPFLKDLAEQTELVGKVTSEQAQQAEDFNKALFALQKNAADAGRSLLQNLLPAINEILKAFNSGGLSAGVNAFGNKLFDWEGNAQRKGIANLKSDIAELQDAANNITFDIFGQKGKIQQEIEAKTAALKAAEQAYFKFNPAAGGGRGVIENPAPMDLRPALPSSLGGGGGGKKSGGGPKDSELDRYIEGLEKQLQKVNELTVAEKLLDDLRTGSLKLQKGETIDRALALAKQVDSLKAMTEYTKLAQAAEKEREDALLKAATTQEEQVKNLTDGNTALREEIEMLGKNAEAQAAIEAARISSAIAIKEEELARLSGTDALEREKDAIEAQIKLLKERQDLVGMRGVAQKLADDAQEAKDFAKQVGAAFESSFEKAILEGGKLSDVLKGLAKDILGLTIRQSITGPISQAISGLLTGGGAAGFANLVSGLGGDGLGAFIGIKQFANGGVPPIGKVSLVGENGPELFVPNTAGTIIPNHALGGGGQPVTVIQQFTVGDVATLSQVREAVAGSERRIAGQIGRSQRYGGALA